MWFVWSRATPSCSVQPSVCTDNEVTWLIRKRGSRSRHFSVCFRQWRKRGRELFKMIEIRQPCCFPLRHVNKQTPKIITLCNSLAPLFSLFFFFFGGGLLFPLYWLLMENICTFKHSNRKSRWSTTYDFATSFLHVSLFSTALWDLATSRPVHSLMLSSHLFLCLPCLHSPFIVPCKMVLARPN